MRSWTVYAVASLLALAGAAQAGTADDPEITDPADDYTLTGGAPDPDGLVKSVDLLAAWVSFADADTLELRIEAGQQMRGGSVQGTPTTQYTYDLFFTVNGAEYMAGGHVESPAPATVTPRGVAATAALDAAKDSIMVLTVPAADIGGLAPGAVISGMYVASEVYASEGTMATDRAPDADAGRDYVVPAPVVGNGTGNTTGNGTGNSTGHATGNATGNMTDPAEGPDQVDGNETMVDGNQTDEGLGEESPGIGLAFPLALLAVAGFVRRRHRC